MVCNVIPFSTQACSTGTSRGQSSSLRLKDEQIITLLLPHQSQKPVQRGFERCIKME